MKKQDSKKPRNVPAVAAGAKVPVKKKRRGKIRYEDKLRALLIAAVLVLAAMLSSLVVIYVQSFGSRPPYAPPAPPPVAEAQPEPAAQPLPPLRELAAQPAESAITPPEQRLVAPAAPAVLPGSKGAVAFVIDDAGNNLRDLEPFLNFPGSITIAVLPGLPYSAEAARRVRPAGKELFLHQPMESIGGTDPGPGAIMAGMGRDEIREIINRNLDEIWPVVGMNNHEGSRVTMDEVAMETILEVSRERGIIFLDSRTSAETAAPRVAQRLGINIGERDIFIDNYPERESMVYFINRGLVRAEQRGSAIMIGHVWSPELAPLLKEMYADLIERGYSFSSVAEILARGQQ